MALLVGFGIKMMKPQRAKKMLIQNGISAGFILVLVIAIIKISHQGKQKRKSSHLSIEAKVV
jgi:hypothetical protein